MFPLIVCCRADGSFPDMCTGLEELRKAYPDDTINDDTDQYITRIVAGELLTGNLTHARVYYMRPIPPPGNGLLSDLLRYCAVHFSCTYVSAQHFCTRHVVLHEFEVC